MKKEIISEINRMKNLLSYKKGVVISEQKIIKEAFSLEKFPCINPEWEKTSGYFENTAVQKFQGKGNDTDKYGNKLSDISFDELGNYYVRGAFVGKFSCSSNNRIALDGVEMKPAKQTTTNTSTAQNSPTALAIPKSLSSKVGDKTGVQAFQDWLDANHSGWHKKYGTLGGDPKKGYGKFGPNTNKAFTTPGYEDEYLKSLNTNNQSNSNNSTSNATNDYKVDPTWLKNNGWIIAVEDGKPNYSFKDNIVNNTVQLDDYQYIIYKDKMTYACQGGTTPSCYSNNGTNIVNKTEDIQSAKKNVGL